jgi:hypothetical protein
MFQRPQKNATVWLRRRWFSGPVAMIAKLLVASGTFAHRSGGDIVLRPSA